MDQEKLPDKTRNMSAAGENAAYDSAVDEFFARLNQDIGHPRPEAESITAALQATQRVVLKADSEVAVNAATGVEAGAEHGCRVCGKQNPPENKFCASCGVPLQEMLPGEKAVPNPEPNSATPASSGGQHHYHHHYHHHYFSTAERLPQTVGAPAATGTRDPSRIRAPLGGASLSRAETAIRQLTQDWALACNSRQLDDLVECYAADALVMRPNIPPVRGTAAIRELFFAALDAGLGEVELEPLRVELLGDASYEAGRCKMLVPVAMGRRREERGKYLMILTRQPAGDWKIVADCWSSDLNLGVAADPAAAKPGIQAPISPLVRAPRKSG